MSAETTDIGTATNPPAGGAESFADRIVKAEPAPEPAQLTEELQRLDPQPVKKVLADGTPFEVEPLKLRQLLAMLRILTSGAQGALMMGGLSSRDGEDFMRQLMLLLFFAIPNAEEETIAFVKSMVRPQVPKGDANYEHLKNLLDLELDNPDPADLVTIVECVVANEADDLQALGKRLRVMFDTATKMGLTKGL